MQQIIYFFVRNKNFLLFLLLFIIALGLTISANSYHTNRFVKSANFLSGNVFRASSSVTNYFGLETENEKLLEENTRLRQQLELYKTLAKQTPDSLQSRYPFQFTQAQVINNNYSLTKNSLTINKGSKDGIIEDMGVISSKGLIGIVNSTSANFATVQSILNTNSQINAKLKKTSHFGTLVWNTQKNNIVQLIQIPRMAALSVGDTIVTGGKSTIFPEGILIGTIKDFELTADDSYLVNVHLFNDMTNLKHVHIIENKNGLEIKTLENSLKDAE